MGIASQITSSWAGILVIAGIAASLWFIVSTWISYRRLAHIPGPRIAALTPWWLFYHTAKGDLYLALREQFEKHGSPIRIAPNKLISSEPSTLRAFTASKGSGWTRATWYDAMRVTDIDNVFSMRDENEHTARRKQLIPGYQGIEVPTLESDIDGQVLNFKQVLGRLGKEGKEFDLAEQVHYLFLDLLTKIAFGKALGYLKEQKDIYNYLATSEAFFPIMELGANHSTIQSILTSPLMKLAAPKKTDQKGLGAIMGFASDTFKERLASGEQKDDMVGSFIKNGLTQEQLESEALILILAGTDSTATGLRITLLHIMTNPLVYNKLQKEIDAVSASVTTPVISNSQAQTLPYLKAVILEGLRMMMPLHGFATRHPPPGGAELEGHWIPHQTEVGFAAYTMLLRKDLFGEDADEFNPERWLGDSPKIAEMERTHALLFGAGRSMCLGKSIALMELRKTIFEIFRAYDLTITNPLKPLYIRSNGAVVIKNLLVRAYPRVKA